MDNNLISKRNKLWNKFTSSGKIEDYLEYRHADAGNDTVYGTKNSDQTQTP